MRSDLALSVAMALLGAGCRRDATPGEPVRGTATVQSAPSAPPRRVAEPARPSPPELGPDQDFAWQIEQDGRPVLPKDHALELARKPFALVVHVRMDSGASVFVNASFSSRTADGARLGWPFNALDGFRGASRVDSGYDKEPVMNNRLRDILLDDHTPNQWALCLPAAKACDGFDGPCEATSAGLVCRRTIERFHSLAARDRPRVDIAATEQKALHLVLVLPGRWTDDMLAGKAPLERERARDWVVVRWAR